MYSRSAANAYRRVDLESAPKYQIVDRLYERFARDVEEARNAIDAKDINAKAKALDHALLHRGRAQGRARPRGGACAVREPRGALRFRDHADQRVQLRRCKTRPLDQAAKIMAELAIAFHEAPR